MTDRQKSAGLVRALGFWSVAAFVFNGMVGAGIFAMPATVSHGAGSAAPLLVALVGLLLLPVVLVFSKLAQLFEETGGPILYVERGFGPTAGFHIGWLQCLSTGASSAANINLLADYATAGRPTAHLPVMFLALAIILVVNLARNSRSSAAIGWLTAGKVLPLILLIVIAIPAVLANSAPWQPAVEWTPGSAMLLAAYGLVGFEGATTIAGEARDPRRDLPRAMLGVFVAVVAGYALLCWAYVALSYDPTTADTTPLATMAGQLAGPAGIAVVGATAVASILGNVLTTTFGLSRRIVALEAIGVLPAALGHIRPDTGLPRNAVLFIWAALAALALSGGFVVLALISVASRLLVYLGSLAAWPRILKRRNSPMMWRDRLLLGLATLMCIGLASQSDLQTWLALCGAVATGAAVLAITRRTRMPPAKPA